LISADVPPEQFALLAAFHRSIIGIHSLTNFFALAIREGVITEAAVSLFIIVFSRRSWSDIGYRVVARLNHIYAKTWR